MTQHGTAALGALLALAAAQEAPKASRAVSSRMMSESGLASGRRPALRRRAQTQQALPTDCPSGFRVQGGSVAQYNGIYLRNDGKTVNGKETYWLVSGSRFWYWCSLDSSWKMNWAVWYGNADKVGPANCFYVAYVDAGYPTAVSTAANAWYAWTSEGGVVPQPAAQATCSGACDVTDGSSGSSEYPCICGEAACVESQKCTAASDSCSECVQIQLAGFDAAAPTGWNEQVDGLYSRDDCKTIDGRETYWHSSGDYYMYYCAMHSSWGISAQHYTDWRAQGGSTCLVKVDAADSAPYPPGVTQWWAWFDSQWSDLEADWHTAITCPVSAYVPPTCSPAVPGPITSSPTVANAPPPTAQPSTPGACPDPHEVADVSWSAGQVIPAVVGSPRARWLPSQSATLHWPEGGAGWLTCASWYRLGSHRKVARGSSIAITCASHVCDVYVFQYHRPGVSGGFNGGLPGTLPAQGFEPGSCAPLFRFDGDPRQCSHRMLAHRKQLQHQGTETITIDADQDAMYMLIAVARGSDCSVNWRTDQETCLEIADNATVSTCRWALAQEICHERWCPQRFVPAASPGSPGGGRGPTRPCDPPDLSDPEAGQQTQSPVPAGAQVTG
eukprot:TRINITY_DN21608_c0_g1_i1.p1 TRINITY_DN21608_c0_g1~~TRINITY_DN21608_c0_g1_i1.p1  ORF type:complete len:613 (+),score=87.50 TRINITY_DN21608_c0_g1_i1:127-1965(+)